MVSMFDSLVKRKGKEEEKKIEELHLRWTLGLHRWTPSYIVLEETKREKMRVDAGKRALKYEEKVKTQGINLLVKECMQEMEHNKTRWGEERTEFMERNKIEREQGQAQREDIKKLVVKVFENERKEQRREQRERIRKSRYNKEYEHLIIDRLPKYLEEENKEFRRIAKFRSGNAFRASCFWKKEGEKKCRLCQLEEETIEHVLRRCWKIEKIDYEEIMDEEGKGSGLMRKLEEKWTEQDKL